MGDAQVRAQAGLCFGDAVVGLEIHLFVLDALPQSFDEAVIPPATLAVHADPDVVRLQQASEFAAGELTALVGVEDLRATVAVNGFAYGVQTEVGSQGVR